MNSIARVLICGFFSWAASGALAAPTQTNGTTVDAIKAAIASQDRAGLRAIDNPIEYVPVYNSQPISSDAAIALLHGCQAQSQAVGSMQFTIVKYACPARVTKLPCTTGNLRLMIYDDNHHTEIGLSEDRVFDGDCPRPPVPLMPAPFEPEIATAVAQSFVDGNEEPARALLTETVQVARSAKFATGSPEVQFQGRGFDAFSGQSKELAALLGRPKSVICDAANFICKFAFDQNDRFLFAAINTRNHKVEFVHVFYSSRAMILERMRQQGQ